MAEESGKTNEAVEAAATAAAAVVESQEQIQEGANDAIARAQAEADAAAKEAERIAGAAINTELGTRIQSVQQENETWRTQFGQRVDQELTKIPVLEQQLAELKTGIGVLLGALKSASPSPSTPPKSEETTPPAPPVSPESENAGDHQKPPAPPAPQRSKRVL